MITKSNNHPISVQLALTLCLLSGLGLHSHAESLTPNNGSTLVSSTAVMFPSGMIVTVQPYYGHREAGGAGRVVTLDFPSSPLNGNVSVTAGGEITQFTNLQNASQLTVKLPVGTGVTSQATVQITVQQGANSLAQTVTVPAKRQWTIMVYPHSHVDIGYNARQADVLQLHANSVNVGMELGAATAGNAPGERNVWNNEVNWPVEEWINQNQGNTATNQAFVAAITSKQIGLSATFDNCNTSAASDEELMRLFDYARKLRKLTGDPVDTMCQMDVPGISWGTVQAAVQNGVKAIFVWPNATARVGNFITAGQYQPFFWVAPDGVSKVFYLQCYPYSLATEHGSMNVNPSPFTLVPGRDRIQFADTPLNQGLDTFLFNKTASLETPAYPYDILPVPWSLSDNSPQDSGLVNYVKQWNQSYAYPKLVMSTASEIHRAFINKFENIIPERSGDLTEYWNDGLGSAAKDVGLARIGKEKLVQAETLWSMLRRQNTFPTSDFYTAWRWVQLATEHTWGWHNPTEPPSTIQQDIEGTKASYFANALSSSQSLMDAAVQTITIPSSTKYAVLNTLSWNRTGLVTLTNSSGTSVLDDQGNAVLSQRLSSGELVFMASNVPALGSRLYTIVTDPAATAFHAIAGFGGTGLGTRAVSPVTSGEIVLTPNSLDNGLVKVQLNTQTGDISSLVHNSHEFVNSQSPYAINSYRYLLGGNAPETAAGATNVSIAIKENGPLVGSLLVTSSAAGCNSLTREIRINAGQPQVEMHNTLDKISTTVKEGVHFGFAFNLPADATTRMDIPWGVMNPKTDQLPGSNKNWFSFQRWIDVSGGANGVTWVGIEPCLVQFGTITANIMDVGTNWLQELGDTRTIVSWALNNHWFTNFPLKQGGVIPFRYAILPHGAYDPVIANRFGLEQNRPMVAVPATTNPVTQAFVNLNNPRVFVSTLKPADDGSGAMILRLRSVSDQPETASLTWPAGTPSTIRSCVADEIAGAISPGSVTLNPYGCLSLRIQP